MTIFEVIIAPAILLGLFLIGVLVLLAWLTRRWVQVLVARRDRFRTMTERTSKEITDIRNLAQTQAAVIDSVIGESIRPTVALSTEVSNALLAAHDTAREMEKRGSI